MSLATMAWTHCEHAAINANSFDAAWQLLRREVKKIIVNVIQLSVWAAPSNSVEKRCGGAQELPVVQPCLALRKRNLKTKHGEQRCA
jgi:hypothetical protein